jgi:hypothetical protein
MPEKRNGMDSQFGMRRVRKSIPDATTSTTTLAHHAKEFIDFSVKKWGPKVSIP